MSKADTVAFEYARTLGEDYDKIYDAVKYGYHQAEKDNELTWNDVALILNTAEEFNRKNTVPISNEEYFKEVLKRFNKERKGE